MDRSLELERKWICPPDYNIEVLIDRLGMVAKVTEKDRLDQRDDYYDSPSRELAAAGLSARCRKREAGQQIDLKVVPMDPELVLARPELSAKIARNARVGPTVAQLVQSELQYELSGEPELVVSLRTERHRFIIETGRCRAELSDDRATVTSRAHARGSSPRFRELELELLEGDREAFEAIAAAISEDSLLTPSHINKLRRACNVIGEPEHRWEPPPPRLGNLMTLDEAAREICRCQLNAIRSYLPGTRIGLDTEHLHKMRVAVRRLRSALTNFRSAFSLRDFEELREGFRWLAAVLGTVRDLDVQILDLPTWQRRYGSEPAAGWERLRKTLEARWQSARAEMLGQFESKKFQRLLSRAERCFTRLPRRNAQHPARTAFGIFAAKVLERRSRQFRKAIRRARLTPVPELIHELRKIGKKLRYTAESLEPLFPQTISAAIKPLKSFQDQLGLFQDNVVAGELAASLLNESLSDSAYCFVLGNLSGGAHMGREIGLLQVEHALNQSGGGSLTREFAAAAARLQRRAERELLRLTLAVSAIPPNASPQLSFSPEPSEQEATPSEPAPSTKAPGPARPRNRKTKP